MIGLTGAWAREAHVAERPLVPGRHAVSQLARRVRARSTTRSSPSAGRRPTRRTARRTGSASSTRATSSPRRRWTPSAPRGSGSASSPRRFAWALDAGDVVHDTRGRDRVDRPTVSAGCRTPSTGSTASGSPAASGATDRGRSSSTTGRGPTSTSTPTGWSRSPRSARELGVELFVLDDGWFGARDDDTTSLGDWIVDRRKLPDGLDGVASPDHRRSGSTSGSGSSPRWSRRGQRAVPRASGLGHRHPRSAADREPPAAGPRHGPRRRSSTTSTGVLGQVLESAPISYIKWDMNRNITEPYGLGAAARAPGRVLPPLHPRRLRPVPAPDHPFPERAVRVVRGRWRPVRSRACSPSRRRPGRATTPTRSSGCASNGAPRWSTRSARWARTSRRCRTTRPAG